MLAIYQKVRAKRRGGCVEWKDGALSIYHNSKPFSCSNHINYRQLFKQANHFLEDFLRRKGNPPLKGEGAIDADQTPLLAPHLDGAEKKFVNLCGRMNRCGQQTDKTRRGAVGLSI